MPKVTAEAFPLPPVTNTPQRHTHSQKCVCCRGDSQHMTADAWEKLVPMFRARVDIKDVQVCAGFSFHDITWKQSRILNVVFT